MDSQGMYLTLPSSASMDIYPSNTLAHYFTNLAKPFTIDRDVYEIGLVEFQLNGYIYNIGDNKDAFTILRSIDTTTQIGKFKVEKHDMVDHEMIKTTEYFLPGTETREIVVINDNRLNDEPYPVALVGDNRYYSKKIGFPKGYYSGVRAIVDALNKELQRDILTWDLRFRVKSFVTDDSTTAVIELISIYGLSLTDSSTFLMYQSAWFNYGVSKWKHSDYAYQLNYILDSKRLMDAPKIAYVYCNLVEHQVVGDVLAQLLRTVHIRENNGAVTVIYENPHYINLAVDDISIIEIYILTVEGKKLPFDSGSLTTKLHLRKKRE